MLGADVYKIYIKKFANYNDSLTTKEVLEILGVSESFIFREIKKGRLKSFLIKGNRYFAKKQLIEYLCSDHYQNNHQLKKRKI